MIEEWRPIPEWEGLYEVSNQGRIRSLDRVAFRSDGRSQGHRGRVLKPSSLASGHLYVFLCDGSRKKRQLLHRAVCHAFHGDPPFEGALCCHRDDEPSNNIPENLYWGTRSDNRRDEVANGRNHRSNRTACPHGHPYDDENTIWLRRYQTKRPRRVCRTCRNAYRNAYRRRQRSEKAITGATA